MDERKKSTENEGEVYAVNLDAVKERIRSWVEFYISKNKMTKFERDSERILMIILFDLLDQTSVDINVNIRLGFLREEVQELLKKGRNAERMMAVCGPLLIISVAVAALFFFFRVYPYLLGK